MNVKKENKRKKKDKKLDQTIWEISSFPDSIYVQIFLQWVWIVNPDHHFILNYLYKVLTQTLPPTHNLV